MWSPADEERKGFPWSIRGEDRSLKFPISPSSETKQKSDSVNVGRSNDDRTTDLRLWTKNQWWPLRALSYKIIQGLHAKDRSYLLELGATRQSQELHARAITKNNKAKSSRLGCHKQALDARASFCNEPTSYGPLCRVMRYHAELNKWRIAAGYQQLWKQSHLIMHVQF
jgi:hypothetical protein